MSPDWGRGWSLSGGPVRPRWSYFLRADTMHSLYSYLEDNPGRRRERFHELSHGEGFLLGRLPSANWPGWSSREAIW